MQDHDCRIILQDLIEMVVRLQAQVEDGGKTLLTWSNTLTAFW